MIKYDQELIDIMHNLMDEVNTKQELLSDKERSLIAIVSLVTQGSTELLKSVVASVSKETLTVTQIKEAVFQCAPYIGYPKVLDALTVVNSALETNGINIDIETAGTVTCETRFENGVDAQATIFGPSMRELALLGENMPRESKLLADNCFGDFYTREGIDLQTREMLTLAILINLGTEPQIKAHIFGNLSMGRSSEYITEVIFGCLVYCGYPRLLNAQTYLKELLEQAK